MEIITASMLQALSTENKKQFEGLLPLIVKKLIIAGTNDLSSLRIPSGDDIWASGFDGIITCATENSYVAAGTSVWEFGNSEDQLSKIESDYKKRTENPLGLDKCQTDFYLVYPRIWAYKKPITEWESEHTDWKTVHIYDASVLCDWINSEPTIVSWLFETLYGKHLDFSGIEQAWNLFSQKTNPAFSYKMFLENREAEVELLVNSLQQPLIKIKSESSIDSIGFVLCALVQKKELKEKCIVVNNPTTFRTISNQVKDKIIIQNFTSTDDIIPSGNSVITCYNKEAISVKPDIQLSPYTKMHYYNAFRDMGMSESEVHELYAFCHGNLRALIRRIPGIANEYMPEWAMTEEKKLLEPIVCLRVIDNNCDKELVEKISSTSFERVEDLYKRLLQKEDTPIKRVENHYLIVNYEEAWDFLGCSVYDSSFDRFHSSVKWLLETLITEGQYSGRFGDSQWIKQHIHFLLLNYTYYSFSANDSSKLSNAISDLLIFATDNRISYLLLDNLFVLAEAAPLTVLSFIEKNLDTHLLSLFHTEDYKHEYIGVLSALDELTLHKSTSIQACRILFSLYQKDYEYKIANSPKESLLTALCLYNSEVALTMQQKRELISYFHRIDASHACELACELIGKNSFWKSVRYGERHNDAQNDLTVREIIDTSEYMAEAAFEYCNACGDVNVLQSLLKQYRYVHPKFLEQLVQQFSMVKFIGKDLVPVVFQLKEQIFSIQKHKSKDEQQYLMVLRLWLDTIQKVCPEEERDDWLFYKTYECPSELLLEYEDDYHKIKDQEIRIRIEKLKEMFSKSGISGIIHAIGRMENNSYWGIILSEVITDVPVTELIDVLLSEKKLAIIGGLINSTSLNNVKVIYSIIPYESRLQVISHVSRLDFWRLLETEEEKKEFWKFKDMISFDEEIYAQFLEYNPMGLLMYFHKQIRKDPLSNLHQAIMVIRSIADKEIDYGYRIKHDEYHLAETVKIIDSAFYSDEWANTTLQLYNIGLIQEMPLSGRSFYFRNPHKFIDYIMSDSSRYYSEQWKFSLPENACDEYDSLIFFVETLIRAGYKRLAGHFIGRMPGGKDGIRIHEIIRALLEDVNDSDFDQAVISGIINSGGLRTVTDGANQKTLSSKYARDASEMELFYPHAASVLRELSHFYMNEGRQDYIHSEVYEY